MMTISVKQLLKKTFIYKMSQQKRQERRRKQIDYLRHYFWIENTEMLSAYCKALNSAGIKFWLEFGTLLGYYREHDFIAHDMDIDTGTYYENAHAVRDALEKSGFKLVREFKVLDDGGIEQCYLYKHITIDVFYFRKDGDKMYCNSFYVNDRRDLTKKKYANRSIAICVKRIEVPLMEYVPAKFKDCDVYVPEDTDRYLRVHYGDCYMTPNPNYNNKKDSTNIVWYDYKEKRGEAFFKMPFLGHPEDYGLI